MDGVLGVGDGLGRRWSARLVVVPIAAVVTLTAVGVVLAADDPGLIHACVHERNGAMRAVPDPAECRTNETVLTWNQQGPEGPAGPPGPGADSVDAGGPRVDPSTVAVAGATLSVGLTAPVLGGTVTTDVVHVSLLIGGAWQPLPVVSVRASGDGTTLEIDLSQSVGGAEVVRLVVRGTGPTPVLGADHVPLAGVTGGPPGTADDGHDAVVMLP